jgi:hypothetical protein
LEYPITFSRKDHWVHIPDPGTYPLVVNPMADGAFLPKTLIDGGSSLNIIFTETLRKMNFDFNKMATCDEPFYGVVFGKAAYPICRVCLPVTFGTQENLCTKYLTFEVADFRSSYYAILGRPMLAKFMAIPHHTYLIMKMSVPNGIFSVLGDIMISYNCESSTVELAKDPACKAATTVMVAQAAKIDQTTLEVPEQKRTNTALDPSPDVKKVCSGPPVASKEVTIGADLDPKLELTLTSFLRDNADIFAWSPSDMPGVSRKLAEHTLEVNKTARPIKQKLRQFAKDRKQAIEVEVCKILATGFIRECKHPVWLANPVLVPKKTGGLRICIDYTDLNEYCPKDPFPLPRIDQVMDSTTGKVLLCFLDYYSGYYQIALNPDDEDKTTFITSHGIYYYKVMTFGLKR